MCDYKMFLSNLSTSILKICDSNGLTYESASELCNLSARYFGDIARQRVTPSVVTLEKLCAGFRVTPNDLLIVPNLYPDLLYREPMAVTPTLRQNYGTRIPTLLRSMWTMSGLVFV